MQAAASRQSLLPQKFILSLFVRFLSFPFFSLVSLPPFFNFFLPSFPLRSSSLCSPPHRFCSAAGAMRVSIWTEFQTFLFFHSHPSSCTRELWTRVIEPRVRPTGNVERKECVHIHRQCASRTSADQRADACDTVITALPYRIDEKNLQSLDTPESNYYNAETKEIGDCFIWCRSLTVKIFYWQPDCYIIAHF